MESLTAIGAVTVALFNLAAALPSQSIEVASPTSVASGTRFRDCHSCPEMIVAPPGTFAIGSPADEAGRGDDEGPQREIRIGQAFAVGRYEVTRQQYEAFLRDS